MDLKNYKLIKKEHIEELSTTGYYFEHNKTKAKVVYLSNNDDNKTFFIGFRTPAPDDTGVPHILEHSVLCGSKKFPIKDPFMELIKGSLQTFLNAMTFPDKTVYPVSSRNDKDFKNLMNVYLDAVLHPRIYTQPEILKQEGWHYQLDKPEDSPTISGVVYNEMKGAFSSPESVLSREILHQMFPDTSYKNESGGIPEFIPNLTQKQFLDFHKRYYHPSNSFIFIHGNGNIEEHLDFIDKEYLCDFEYSPPNSEIQMQKPFEKTSEKTNYYPVAKEDSLDDKTYLSLNFAIGQSSDPVNATTIEILSYILLDSEAAPLKKALLDAGIGKDVYGSSETDIQQPVFSIFSKNANPSQKEDFKNVIFDTLKKIVSEGIDKELIRGAINSKEFAMREADFGGFPKGLLYGIGYVMPSWLYDKDPFKYLHYEKTLSELKKALSQPLFEDFIEKNILSNPHSCFLVLEPKPGLNEENQEKLQNKLAEYKKTLSEKEIKDLIQDNKDLVSFQTAPDLEENLEKLPVLQRSDIRKEIEILPQTELKIRETETHYHDINTNGILYETFFFSMKHLKQEDVKWAGLLLDVIGKMDTKNYSYGDLNNQINIHTGGIGYSSSIIPLIEDSNRYNCFATVSTKVLTEKIETANSLILEVIQKTDFSDKKRVLETIEVDFLASYYVQNGDNASVTGGIGNEFLTDVASSIIISLPLNADDVLTIDAGISAYTSASSSNGNPFDATGASGNGYDDDDDYDDKSSAVLANTTGSPWVASSGASKSDVWSTINADYSHTSDDRNFSWNANASFSSEYDYTSVGFGGGSSYLALLTLVLTSFFAIRSIALAYPEEIVSASIDFICRGAATFISRLPRPLGSQGRAWL